MNCENWWFLDEAPWESRVTALIPHISSVEVKCEAIMLVLKSAPVPWTATVSQLADLGTRLPYFLANDIRNECNNVPKRLIMKKYGVFCSEERVVLLVNLILKKNQDSMLEDIKVLAKNVKYNVSDIYVRVLSHLIEKGEVNMAREILLKTLDDECRQECLNTLLILITRHISFNAWQKLDSYFLFMPTFEGLTNKAFFNDIKNIFYLKSELGISVTYEKMCSPFERQNILEVFAQNTAIELLSGDVVESTALKKVCRLAFLLHLTREEAIITLANLCAKQDLQLALRLSNEIKDLDSKSVKVFNKMKELMGSLTASYKPVESESTVIEIFTEVTSKITRSYRTHCPNNHLVDYSGITLFSHSGCSTNLGLFVQNSSSGKSVLNIVYRDPAPHTATTILVHSSVKNMIQYFSKSCGTVDVPVAKNSMLETSVELNTEKKDLMAIWQRLREEQQDLACIRLVCEYCWLQKLANPLVCENMVDNFLNQCIRDLLKKLFRLRNFDMDLALSFLHFFGKDEAMHFLVQEAQSVGFNYQRLGSISELALTYCNLNGIDKHTKSFKKHHLACKWAKKLNELGLPYKDAFKDTDMERKQLLVKLMALSSTSIALLKEFCLDMYYDIQECLMMYLEFLLLNWEPDMVIIPGPSPSEKEMVVKNTHEVLLHKCRMVLNELGIKIQRTRDTGAAMAVGTMTWSEPIQNDLCNMWNKVNCYYYEVYQVLGKLYQLVLTQESVIRQVVSYQTMLSFFKNYRRISSPSEAEQEQWFQLFPTKNSLPPIANFRLPFTPFLTKEPPWAFIKPELSLKTYKMWYDIVPQLGLDQDMLCTLTIQRLSSEQLGGGGGARDRTCPWRLEVCNTSVLQEIKECVNKIQNQEMASAALYWVVNHMPPGADQKAAACLCYSQAEKWAERDSGEKARQGFAKVQKKYLTVCTSHILHSNGLGSPDYLQLVLHPQELIASLYNDPSILQRSTGTLSHCPDINGVVFEIGHLHHVNVVGIQQELLSEWLCPPDQPPLDTSCDDMTQNLVAIHQNPLAASDSHSIIRACYVLKSMDAETAAKYLVSFAGLREEGEGRPTAVRLRALQCLCTIASDEIVLKVTGNPLDKIKANVQLLLFISELEKLGLVWSLKGFESCDKEDVVRILLVKRSPQAVQLAAALGLVYKLTNIHYWDQTLQLMTSYAMVDELSILLPELTGLCHLLNQTIFTGAWNCALISPFQKAEHPLSEECSHLVSTALELLYCCPMPRQVNLTLMMEHCKRLHSPHLEARLEPFLHLSSSSNTVNVNVNEIRVKTETLINGYL